MAPTAADIAAFARDGFVLIDGYFGRDEMEEFAAAFAQLDFATDGEIYDAAAQMPEFLRLAAKPETALWANALLGRPEGAPLYLFTARCRIDRPQDQRRTYGWHQEVFYTMPGSRFVQTWAPLIRDTTVENGTIEVCPGSHREGIARASWEETEGRALQVTVAPDVVARYEAVAVPMRLGQMLIFDGRLFHRSGHNASTQTRYSMVGQYHGAGFRPPRPTFDWRGQTPREYFRECARGWR